MVERCEEILRETVSRVRVGENEGERFWMGKEGKGPLSPCLFTLLIADLTLEEEGLGEIKIRSRKIYSLAYADDVVVWQKRKRK